MHQEHKLKNRKQLRIAASGAVLLAFALVFTIGIYDDEQSYAWKKYVRVKELSVAEFRSSAEQEYVKLRSIRDSLRAAKFPKEDPLWHNLALAMKLNKAISDNEQKLSIQKNQGDGDLSVFEKRIQRLKAELASLPQPIPK